MQKFLRQTIRLIKKTVAGAQRHRIPGLSAALAFYAIFSLAPLIVITISLTGVFLGSDQVEARIVDETRGLVGDAGAHVVQNIISKSRRPATNVIAFTTSLLFLFFGASRVFVHMSGAMETIWERRSGGVRSTIKNRLIGVAMVVGAVVALFLGVITKAVSASVLEFAGERWGQYEVLFVLVDAVVTFVFVAFLIAVVYRYLPRANVRWSAAWSGAALATILFLIGDFAFGLYLRLGVTNTLQGAAGSLVVLVLWIYYVAQIIFLGAEFTRARMVEIEEAEGAA